MNIFIQGILAGGLIGLGGCSLLSVSIPIVNALFFAVCLLTIVQLQLKLYTGAIGYLGDGVTLSSLLQMFLGNVVGVFLLGSIIKNTNLPISDLANTILLNKETLICNLSIIEILLLGFMCGIFVHIAVSVWKIEKIQSYTAKCVITLWAISSFILCGFEHCIADMFYLFVASENIFPVINQIIFIGLLVLGNGFGGLFCHYTYKVSSK